MATRWVNVANFASVLEAEMFAERLRSAGLFVTTRGNDIVGLFGPGFSGPTARGVDVLVTSDGADAAREILADYNDEDDE
jgi:hypothetical protein